jgi:Mn-containing catalase
MTPLSSSLGFKKGDFTDDELAFYLRVAIQHGDNHLAYLVERNKNNKSAIKHLFGAITAHGVRVDWRAEYALSQMNREVVMDFINNLTDEAKNRDSMRTSINRIKNDTLKNFLLKQEKSGDQKMAQHAAQVLRQTEQAYLTFSR